MAGDALLIVIKTLASLSSMATNLSPSLDIYRVYQRKSCGEVQILPLVSLWGACHLWMMYGFLSDSLFPIFATFLAGSLLAVTYLSVYFVFTHERRRVTQHVAVIALWNALTLLFSFSGSDYLGLTSLPKATTGDWIGYVAAATSLLLYASPFATLARVLKTKSVASIPIALVLAGALNSFFWSIYGFMESDEIVSVPNTVCVVFSCTQAAVYCIVSRQNKRALADRMASMPASLPLGLLHSDIDKRDAHVRSTVDIDRSNVVVVVASDDAVCSSDSHAFVALASPRVQ